jgi:hypothetical protein
MNEIARISAVIAKLEDLKRQATVERSHNYVGATVTEAIAMLYEYLATFKEPVR